MPLLISQYQHTHNGHTHNVNVNVMHRPEFTISAIFSTDSHYVSMMSATWRARARHLYVHIVLKLALCIVMHIRIGPAGQADKAAVSSN